MDKVILASPVRIIKKGKMSDLTKAVRYFSTKGKYFKSKAVTKLNDQGLAALSDKEKKELIAFYNRALKSYRRKVGTNTPNYREIDMTGDEYEM